MKKGVVWYFEQDSKSIRQPKLQPGIPFPWIWLNERGFTQVPPKQNLTRFIFEFIGPIRLQVGIPEMKNLSEPLDFWDLHSS